MLQACSFPGGAVGGVSGGLSLLPGAGPQSGGPPNPSRLGPSSSAEIGDWDVSAEGVISSKGHKSRLSLPLVWQNINKQHPMQCITHWVMARGNEGTPALQGHCGKPPRAMLPECRDISSARGHLASLVPCRATAPNTEHPLHKTTFVLGVRAWTDRHPP